MAAEYQARRDLVVSRLQRLPGIHPLTPDAGLFVMVDVRELTGGAVQPSLTSDDVRRFLLERHGLVVIHGSAYGPGGEGFLRVSFAAGGQTLDRGLALLREGLSELASGACPKERA
jgi:aspartate/methionine/tyrosine aminotransferase